MRFRGSSGRSAGETCSPGAPSPPNTDPESILEGVPAPLGETDLEPEGVEVEAKRDETDALEALYGNVDTEEVIDWVSREPRIFDILSEEGAKEWSGCSKGAAWLGDVMKTTERASVAVRLYCLVGPQPLPSAATCGRLRCLVSGEG